MKPVTVENIVKKSHCLQENSSNFYTNSALTSHFMSNVLHNWHHTVYAIKNLWLIVSIYDFFFNCLWLAHAQLQFWLALRGKSIWPIHCTQSLTMKASRVRIIMKNYVDLKSIARNFILNLHGQRTFWYYFHRLVILFCV